MESIRGPVLKVGGGGDGGGCGGSGGVNGGQQGRERCGKYFQMPLHYPRYSKSDYETMPEWKLDCLLSEYGLPVAGEVEQKREFAIGAFLWQH